MDNFNLKKYLVENKLTKSSQLNELTINQDPEGFKEEVFSHMKDIATKISLNPELDKRHRANDFAYLKQWMKGPEFKEDMATAGMNNMKPKETAELVMKSLGYYDYE